ncbi:uncharacterized protein LOC118280851 [Spodoptera frugiperda]|uniref:Uncharacterized protein LOC118280851 n=1 Tax=Spodoptera frugiperda TaxID=7108 RepID=A0A9R0DK67_SPOFR|nr:uncharacterized protein LOC118280851 [Spodoptera frugiperda]
MSDSQLYWSCRKAMDDEPITLAKFPMRVIVPPIHPSEGPAESYPVSPVPDDVQEIVAILERSASLPDFIPELQKEHSILSFQHSFYVISGDNNVTSGNDMEVTEPDLNAPSTSNAFGSMASSTSTPPDGIGTQSARLQSPFNACFIPGDMGPVPFRTKEALEKMIVINNKIDAAKENENIKIIEKEVYRLHNEATHAYYNHLYETSIAKLKIAEAFLNLAITCDYDQFDRIRKLMLRTYISLADSYKENKQISQCIVINQRINTEFSVDDVIRYKFIELQLMTENSVSDVPGTAERRV